ncbi:MAG: DUF4388 domain-containing protein [Deltaproteobacteria bacterium]
MQHILVCAQDSVLAKKVRFLLARDECDVEILSKAGRLQERLGERDVSLLILSRSVNGEDAIEMLAGFDAGLQVPPTIVLGGQQTVTADFIHLIPDPIDTQAIYRIASDILAIEDDDFSSDDEDLTHIAVNPPQKTTAHDFRATDHGNLVDDTDGEDVLKYSDVTGLDEIAGRLDQLESDQLNDQLSDAFDIDEISEVASPPSRRPQPKNEPPVLGGLLEPARFAKVLFQCWSKQTTGALIVARDHETLTIHFESGQPVHVESSIPGDQLGRALVARGRITEAQYADGAKRAIERGIRLGQALIDLGFFTSAELGNELGTNARDQIAGCFEARQGAFEFDSKRPIPTDERPYRLDVAHVLAEGLRQHADEPVLEQILGDIDARYFKLRKSIDDVSNTFPLRETEPAFLAFGGRAYNVADAADITGIALVEAKKLLAILTTCEEVEEFTPGVNEFESRIREERERARELEARASQVPAASTSSPGTPQPPPPPPAEPTTEQPPAFTQGGAGVFNSSVPSAIGGSGIASVGGGTTPPPPPPSTPSPTFAPKPAPSSSAPVPAAPANGEEIPPMPAPTNGEGMIPRPLVYAKPLPRGPDGSALETPERTLSREHFQRGVTLLGQGNFASAEEAFRDAVALCSEEHVYLIGLARAIYYNPGYQAGGKVPVLKAIVGRAETLSPEDKRVATLKSWVDHAEGQL